MTTPDVLTADEVAERWHCSRYTVMALVPQFPVTPPGALAPRIPAAVDRQYRELATAEGWSVRSLPEARVAYTLSRLGMRPDQVATQARVGRYRLDFAVPDVRVGIEVDGPLHRLPETAARDLTRDLELAESDWIVFRVDAYGSQETIEARLVRIVRFINAERLVEGRFVGSFVGNRRC